MRKVSPSADNFGGGVTGELVRPCQGSTVPETQTNTDVTPTFIGMSSGSTEDNKHVLVSLRNSFLSFSLTWLCSSLRQRVYEQFSQSSTQLSELRYVTYWRLNRIAVGQMRRRMSRCTKRLRNWGVVHDKGLTTRKIIPAPVLDTETGDVGTPDERMCGSNGSSIVHLDNKILLTCSTVNKCAV